jgi:hypothetical protein
MRILFSLAAAVLVAAPLPAAACSVAADYRIPTNLELVESADLILLATVDSGTAMDAIDDPDAMRIDITPVASIKGDIAAAPTTLPIALAPARLAIPSHPYDLENAHPLSQIGGCIRYMVPKGSRVLFFLNRSDDGWAPAGEPFSRWAEDVLTDDAPWLQIVRLYAEAAALPADDRAPYLTTRRDEYGARRDDPVAQLIAADIARQLAGPNPPLRGELPPAPDDTGD